MTRYSFRTRRKFRSAIELLLTLGGFNKPGAAACRRKESPVTKFKFLSLLLVLACGAEISSAHPLRSNVGSQIEITEIKNAGVSAAKETHSIVQVSWTMQGGSDVKISGFELLLEVTYADGYVEKSPARATGNIRSNRFEVPTLHRTGTQPAAEMKSFKVSITTNYSETATRRVSL